MRSKSREKDSSETLISALKKQWRLGGHTAESQKNESSRDKIRQFYDGLYYQTTNLQKHALTRMR